METVQTSVSESKSLAAAPVESKRGRRTRQQAEETVRYFLAKEGSASEKPELGAEVASEGEH